MGSQNKRCPHAQHCLCEEQCRGENRKVLSVMFMLLGSDSNSQKIKPETHLKCLIHSSLISILLYLDD